MKKSLLAILLLSAFTAPLANARDINRRIDARFEFADVSDDDLLDPLEFRSLQPKKVSIAFSQFRFNAADLDDSGTVTLVEFRASRGGIAGGRASRVDIFLLCDLDDDSNLDPDEYINSLPPSLPLAKAIKSFNKRDRDDDGVLSTREFGIRRGFPLPL